MQVGVLQCADCSVRKCGLAVDGVLQLFNALLLRNVRNGCKIEYNLHFIAEDNDGDADNFVEDFFTKQCGGVCHKLSEIYELPGFPTKFFVVDACGRVKHEHNVLSF